VTPAGYATVQGHPSSRVCVCAIRDNQCFAFFDDDQNSPSIRAALHANTRSLGANRANVGRADPCSLVPKANWTIDD